MKKTTRRIILVLPLAFSLFVYTQNSFGCGPFTLYAVFTFTGHPEFPLEKFADGKLGILQPTYARSYLYVAYRNLNGMNFSPQEQKALVELWNDRLEYRWESGVDEAIAGWLAARKKVEGVGPDPQIDPYRRREKPNEYETYLNCQK